MGRLRTRKCGYSASFSAALEPEAVAGGSQTARRVHGGEVDSLSEPPGLAHCSAERLPGRGRASASQLGGSVHVVRPLVLLVAGNRAVVQVHEDRVQPATEAFSTPTRIAANAPEMVGVGENPRYAASAAGGCRGSLRDSAKSSPRERSNGRRWSSLVDRGRIGTSSPPDAA